MKEAASPFTEPKSEKKSRRAALLAVLAIALAIRLANFPARHELRDGDEFWYGSSGLVLLEGNPPTMKTTPNGPQAWLGAMYGAVGAARRFLNPPDEWRSTPAPIRVFLAFEQMLFDNYRDYSSLHRFLLAWQTLLSLLAVYVAFGFGWELSGWLGGLLLGSTVAALPLFVEYVAMTRAYSDAWSFAWIAIGLSAWPEVRWLRVVRMVAYGLAVASRIEMLILAPLIVLLDLRFRSPKLPARKQIIQDAAGSAAVAYMAAPWLLTNFFGLVRTIATVRVAGQTHVPNPRWQTFVDLSWHEGLCVLFAFTFLLMPLVIRRSRWPDRLIVALALLWAATMFLGPYQPMRYHAAVLITWMVLAGLSMARLSPSGRQRAAIPVALSIAFVLMQGTSAVKRSWDHYVDADVVQWLDTNAPPNSFVYLCGNVESEVPLPTPSAAEFLWKEVSDDDAWRRKFQRGLSRFHLDSQHLPRAFSEENLWLERGGRRRWFILGADLDPGRPRYQIRVRLESPIFGVQDLTSESHTTGGFIIYRGEAPDPNWGPVRRQWLAADGTGVFIVEAQKGR